jgi:hypothetical protein
MLEFLQAIIKFLNRENIQYMLSGSVALSIYTLPRATRDFDFVIHLKTADVEKIMEAFKDGYYCDKDGIEDAINRKSMFNIIDHASGFKADFIILKEHRFRLTEFKRRRQADFFGIPLYVVSAEDLLLSKLIWIQEFQSNIQLEDIKNLAALSNLDWDYIRQWIDDLKLNTFGLI